jgi:hypothetical protein
MQTLKDQGFDFANQGFDFVRDTQAQKGVRVFAHMCFLLARKGVHTLKYFSEVHFFQKCPIYVLLSVPYICATKKRV